ncbi:hypothetical protein P3T37_003544 [Kitasatospora sp. MAA4]|uniref:hypothetical protein n=1 Tax=Kitasatospora sp. MAA4 TaxID=3035093 RepID=UPI0024740DE4|nr:hypothetical protein [Kitasatospora sp. MAA4]MDH6134142.1 hypothetical protein [Kitasatospora sp. MAA4]
MLGALAPAGMTAVSPGQTRVLSPFGRYTGTMRDTGLRNYPYDAHHVAAVVVITAKSAGRRVFGLATAGVRLA